MKKIALILTLLISSYNFAQELTNKKEKNVAFAIIEQVPVHANCNETLSNSQLKNCINKEMRDLIIKEFNTELANKLGLPGGKIKIYTFFTINKEGLVDDIKIRAPHPELKNEALRILNLIPKFKKPGFQKGKPVSVSFALPINFMVDDGPTTEPPTAKPLTKKEKKALAKTIKKLERAQKRELKRAKREAKKKQ